MSKVDPKASRGYRNRNPGNIEHNERNKWLGLDNPPSDGRFCRFVEHRYGIRAMALLLMAYYDRHGCDTVAKLIARWAPSSENPTTAYASMVAKTVGVSPTDKIDVHDPATMYKLVSGIIRFELGGMPYTENELWDGLAMAGFSRPKPASIAAAVATDTGKGAVVTGAAGLLGVVLTTVRDVGETLASVPALAALPPWVGVAVIAVAVVGVLFWRSRRR